MVREIRYSEYKKFCDKIPCKDLFYFIDNIFICFKEKPDKILCIKTKKAKYLSTNKVLYNHYKKLESMNVLKKVSLNEFLLGVTHRESRCHIDETFYSSNSFLIIV